MVAHAPDMPSRLLLPVVPDVTVPAGLPNCPGLRGEPCRDYQGGDAAPGDDAPAPTPAPDDPLAPVTGVLQGVGQALGQVVQTLPVPIPGLPPTAR
jgi:hypothetical protein